MRDADASVIAPQLVIAAVICAVLNGGEGK
jgi:hypothetical protein